MGTLEDIEAEGAGSLKIRFAMNRVMAALKKAVDFYIKKYAEENKVAIRSIRRDGIEEFKAKQKNSEITEDDLRNAEEQIQKLTDKYIAKVDSTCAENEKEVMSV